MTRLEDIVGAAVRNLADSAPNAHDLAAVARTRGRRIRRRRQATLGAAALALVLVAAAPFVVFRDRQAPPPTTPAPTPSISASRAPTVIKVQNKNWWKQPYRLPGGVIVTALTRTNLGGPDPAGKTVKDGNVVLDRATGEYWALPDDYSQIWGSPTGPYTVASDGNTKSVIIKDRATTPRWTPYGFILDPQWSPDGKTLLFTGNDRYTLLNAATGVGTRIDATEAMASCPDYCFFTWLPNGKEIALARIDPTVKRSEAVPSTVKDVIVCSATSGKKLRTLPVRGVPIGPGAWSPDGNLVIASDQPFQNGTQLVIDVRSGATVGQVIGGNVRFLPDGRILSIRDTKAEVYDTKGTLLETQQLPNDFVGRTVSVGLP